MEHGKPDLEFGEGGSPIEKIIQRARSVVVDLNLEALTEGFRAHDRNSFLVAKPHAILSRLYYESASDLTNILERLIRDTKNIVEGKVFDETGGDLTLQTGENSRPFKPQP